MGSILVASGVIDSERAFRIYTKLTKTDRLLKPGEYQFTLPTPIQKVVEDLVNENVVTWKITVPEGASVKDIAQLIKNSPLEDKASFEQALNDTAFMKQLAIEGTSFEGFLFPETYTLTLTTPGKVVIQSMVKRFFVLIDPNGLKQKAKTLALIFSFEWVTLASVVEKETGNVAEQPKIASVFHNRLKLRMRLQSDPTVIYGIPNYNGNITKKDLQTPSPYNTYTNNGLPVGPIEQ